MNTNSLNKPYVNKKKARLVLPKEHGTWMMFFLPYLLGVTLFKPSLLHIPLLLGWFSLFLASTPLLNLIRNNKVKAEMMPWLIKYLILAVIFLLPIIWLIPSLMLVGTLLIPLLMINIYFIKVRNERSLWNNLSGIITFALGGVAAVVLGEGSLSNALFLLVVITLYFMGSAFYVKSLIRERKNHRFKKLSHLYHGLVLLTPFSLGMPMLFFVFLPGALKDWFTSRKQQMKPMQIGIIEIINGVVFFIVSMIIM